MPTDRDRPRIQIDLDQFYAPQGIWTAIGPITEEKKPSTRCISCRADITDENPVKLYSRITSGGVSEPTNKGCSHCVRACQECSKSFNGQMTNDIMSWYQPPNRSETHSVCKSCLSTKDYVNCEGCYAWEKGLQPSTFKTIDLTFTSDTPHDLLVRRRRDGKKIKKTFEVKEIKRHYCTAYCKPRYEKDGFCADCKEGPFVERRMYSYGRKQVCANCIIKHGDVCTSCSNTDKADAFDMYGECKGCAKKVVKSYSFRPAPRFLKLAMERSPFYFGMELEVESRKKRSQEMAKELREALGPDFYFKEDGSLSYNHGIEIVSHPMTLAYFRQQEYDKKIESFKDELAAFFRKNCGLHFHISKSAFKGDEAHMFRFVEFHFQNKKFIQFIGQRKLNHFCVLNKDTKKERIKTAIKNKESLSAGHYDAVNIENEHTVELRYFRANVLGPRLIKNMEFIRCLFEFTKTATDDQLLVPHFLEYLTKHRKRYGYLYEFIDTRNRIFAPVLPDIYDTDENEGVGDDVDTDGDASPNRRGDLPPGAYMISTYGGTSASLVQPRT